jgi:hypothetical protein
VISTKTDMVYRLVRAKTNWAQIVAPILSPLHHPSHRCEPGKVFDQPSFFPKGHILKCTSACFPVNVCKEPRFLKVLRNPVFLGSCFPKGLKVQIIHCHFCEFLVIDRHTPIFVTEPMVPCRFSGQAYVVPEIFAAASQISLRSPHESDYPCLSF